MTGTTYEVFMVEMGVYGNIFARDWNKYKELAMLKITDGNAQQHVILVSAHGRLGNAASDESTTTKSWVKHGFK